MHLHDASGYDGENEVWETAGTWRQKKKSYQPEANWRRRRPNKRQRCKEGARRTVARNEVSVRGLSRAAADVPVALQADGASLSELRD